MLIMTKKTFIFAKNPTSGGIPAIENIATHKKSANMGLDLLNNAKSPNSLLYLLLDFFFFNCNNKIIFQTTKLENM
jgi:hypothetical protein